MLDFFYFLINKHFFKLKFKFSINSLVLKKINSGVFIVF
jgi:hypothetical protein